MNVFPTFSVLALSLSRNHIHRKINKFHFPPPCPTGGVKRECEKSVQKRRRGRHDTQQCENEGKSIKFMSNEKRSEAERRRQACAWAEWKSKRVFYILTACGKSINENLLRKYVLSLHWSGLGLCCWLFLLFCWENPSQCDCVSEEEKNV